MVFRSMTPPTTFSSTLGAAPLAKYVGEPPRALVVERRTVVLDLRTSGRLVPWLGPALRGITALRYRATVCQQPQAEWAGRWKHCRGCSHAATCGYGIAFEPEMTGSHADAVRRLVIAPAFPAPIVARRGEAIAVQITSIGVDVHRTVPGVVAALAAAGQRDGLGPDRVRFVVEEESPRGEEIILDPKRLTSLTAPSPTLARLTISLNSPLFLRERESRTRRVILDPDFRTLLRHAVRIVGEFFPSIAPDDTGPFEDVAAAVPTIEQATVPFRQEKASRRTHQRFELEGVVGSITFADVPANFLPWLVLAGLVHVGGHRVAGAGGWTVQTETAATGPRKL